MSEIFAAFKSSCMVYCFVASTSFEIKFPAKSVYCHLFFLLDSDDSESDSDSYYDDRGRRKKDKKRKNKFVIKDEVLSRAFDMCIINVKF